MGDGVCESVLCICAGVCEMKQVDNTECGPIIVCNSCFESMNRYSIEIGEGGIGAKDVTGIVPEDQQCDLCGDRHVRVRL